MGGGPSVSTDDLGHAHYREVMGRFASGVTIVTTLDDDGPSGFTCQAFLSLSLDPELVALGAATSSRTWTRIQRVGRFCVNVLSDGQESLARAFAEKADLKFEGVGWHRGPLGTPVLEDTVAWAECDLLDVHPAGDHALAVGKVGAVGSGDGRPLVFYRGGYGTFGL